MAYIKIRVQDASAMNKSLLDTISETEYAVPALREQTEHADQLDKDLKQAAAKISKLSSLAAHAKWENTDLKTDRMRRFTYKATGRGEKFDTRMSEASSKYIQAQKQENEAIASKESLEGLLREAEEVQAQLVPVVEKHDDAEARLDALYDSIFAGPTPSYPEEDEKEEIVKTKVDAHDVLQKRLGYEEQVVKILQEAQVCCRSAAGYVDSARSYNSWGTFGGGGMISNIKQHNRLDETSREVSRMLSLYQQAERTSPFVKPLKQFQTEQGSVGMVWAFGSLANFGIREGIKDSQMAIDTAQRQIQEQMNLAWKRIRDLKNQVLAAEQQVSVAKLDLRRVRSKIFEQLGGTA